MPTMPRARFQINIQLNELELEMLMRLQKQCEARGKDFRTSFSGFSKDCLMHLAATELEK